MDIRNRVSNRRESLKHNPSFEQTKQSSTLQLKLLVGNALEKARQNGYERGVERLDPRCGNGVVSQKIC
ncbi:hypothetical protein TSUD_218970 [Trifolium subterraneum]|uniref:Uncharacterized protein n=1 Tax=Trifolium subterraneum TaxID=3900 RepID=A0A2Z6MK82_TRISU|nr:hypothetical protein TSUD_218970 [Trifolium subterraneum]